MSGQLPPKILAMIPARRGSTRLKQKNLAMLGGRPMITYAIDEALHSGVFDDVFVNSEDEAFEPIALERGACFYRRNPELATSQARSDEVVLDFMNAHACDVVVWVNSIAPLQPAEEIRMVVEYFLQQKLDSLITVKNEQVHALYKDEPLNFDPQTSFARTQDLEPVKLFVYSLMMWRKEAFIQAYQQKGHAIMCGNFGTYPVGKASQIIIKYAEDLQMAEAVLRQRGC